MKRRSEQYARELRDPALSAMLKATFADDPALEAAPGRSERIMRQVLASGMTPVRRTFNWAPFGWTFAAAGAAVLVMTLSIGLVRLPAGWGPEMKTTVAQIEQTKSVVQPRNTAKPAVMQTQDEFAYIPQADSYINDPSVAQPEQPAWKTPVTEPKQRQDAIVPSVKEQSSPEQSQTEMAKLAASLYDAGSTAHAAGDLPTAYAAYQASYDTLPMPNALMATSDVLGRLADDELDAEQG